MAESGDGDLGFGEDEKMPSRMGEGGAVVIAAFAFWLEVSGLANTHPAL